MDNKEQEFVEVKLVEKVAQWDGCENGCQRAKGSPTGG